MNLSEILKTYRNVFKLIGESLDTAN